MSALRGVKLLVGRMDLCYNYCWGRVSTRNQLLVVVGLTVLIMVTSIHECSRIPEEPEIIASAKIAVAGAVDSTDEWVREENVAARHRALAELLVLLNADTADLISDSSAIGRCLLREQYGEWGEDDGYLARLALVRELARELADRARGH